MKKILTILIFLPVFGISQTQIGTSIFGTTSGDAFGWSLSNNNLGDIMAVGSPNSDVNGSNSGQVRVYQNQSGSWVQLGQNINGEAAGDEFGWSISLSSDGNVLAIGSPNNDTNGNDAGYVRVFQYQSNSWVQIGQNILGTAAGDGSGYSVKLNSDGSILAISSYLNNLSTGRVRVYQNQSSTWVQLGTDITGINSGDEFGRSVSLSGDGSILGVGATGSSTNGSRAGQIRVFQNQAGNWTQIGSTINGANAGDQLGHAVSLNNAGDIMAVGANRFDGSGIDSGSVKVYENQANNWIQLGQDIFGESGGDRSGQSVSLNSDGSVLAIGSNLNSNNGSAAGNTRVFQFQSTNWVQIGQDIDGDASGDVSGWSVSLSGDNQILAIGAPANDGNGAGSGQVRVYDLNETLGINNQDLAYLNVYPNPTKNIINIKLPNNVTLKSLRIVNNLGKLVLTPESKIINTSTLSTGLYYLIIETDQGNTTKKLIIE
ncbi:T9SS type A sorting domain-containing protein [Gaetbulibacter sp. M240]|uniref:T9SS type A sorting domain-containing protein n=1 Tax=Gaetbulibacter sp. M240 TaxID=3126511 RepID=UPI00374FB372